MLADKLRSATSEGLSYVGGYAQYYGNTGGTTTVSLTSLSGGIDTTVRTDDLVLVFQSRGGSFSVSTPPTPTGYTSIYRNLVGSAFETGWSLAYKKATVSDTSVQLDTSVDSNAVLVQVWRAQKPTTPIPTTNQTAISNSGRPRPPAVTPTALGAVVAVFGANSFSATSVPTLAPVGLSSTLSAVGSGTGVAAGYVPWVSGTVDPSTFNIGASDSTNYSSVGISVVIDPT